MRILRGVVPALVVVTLVTAACGGDPEVTAPPASTPSPTPTPTPAITEIPFAAAAFPVDRLRLRRKGLRRAAGSGRDAVTPAPCGSSCVRPTPPSSRGSPIPSPACSTPTSFARLARDPDVRPTLAGTGPYVVDRWVPGENVCSRVRRRMPRPMRVNPVIVVAWDPDAAAADERPRGRDRSTASTRRARRSSTGSRRSPSSSSRTAPGLATAFLAFGAGPAFSGAAVRRAIAGSIDRGALVTAAFPAGTTVPSHVTPCIVAGRLRRAGLVRVQRACRRRVARDRRVRPRPDIPAPRPRRARPGPAGPRGRRGGRQGAAGDEPRPQGLGRRDARRRVPRRPSTEGTLNSLYLDGVASPLADASGFLEPLFGDGVRSTPGQARDRRVRRARAGGRRDRRRRPGRDHRRGEHGDPRRSAVIVPARPPGLDGDVPERRRGRGDLAAGARPARGGDARRPAAARVRAGDRARAGRGAATSRRWTPSACAACSPTGCTGSRPAALTPEPRLARACRPTRRRARVDLHAAGRRDVRRRDDPRRGRRPRELRGGLGRGRADPAARRPTARSPPGTRCSAGRSARAAERGGRRRGGCASYLTRCRCMRIACSTSGPIWRARPRVGRGALRSCWTRRREAGRVPGGDRVADALRPGEHVGERRVVGGRPPPRSPGSRGCGPPAPGAARSAWRGRRRRPTSPRGPRTPRPRRGRRRPS